MRQWSAANASLDASIEGNESVRLRCSRHAISVKGVGQDGYGLEVAGGAVLRREVGQESHKHNAAGACGDFVWVALRRPPSSSSTCSPRKRRAPTRTGRCMGRRRRAPPRSSFVVHHARSRSPHGGGGRRRRKHHQGGAHCAHQLDQEQASGKRPLVLGPSGGCPRRLALRTAPPTLHVIM